MQATSTQKIVSWRPIDPLLQKVDPEVVKRLETLRQTAYGKSPTEIYMQFNPTTIGEAAALRFARGARIVEAIRNASVFLPLMLMLCSFALASQAYAQSPHTSAPDSIGGNAFFNAWINGFPSLSSVTVFGILSISIHWLTFTDVLLYDGILLSIVIGLTITSQAMEGRVLHKTRKLTIWLNEELTMLCDSSKVKPIGIGPGSEQPEWAVRVNTAIDHLHEVLKGVEGTVDLSQKKFADTIERFTDVYTKQNQTVDTLLRGVKDVSKTVDDLGGIHLKLYEASSKVADALPSISEQLKQAVSSQEEMTRQLKSMTADIHQLVQPFRTVGLAEMARQIEQLQRENLTFLKRMEERLSRAVTSGWLSKWFSR